MAFSEEHIPTYFAPAERATEARIRELHNFVLGHPLFQAIIESIDGYMMILNPERQVLAMNPSLLTALGIDSVDCLLGERPGEILGCVHSHEMPGGCGTSKACSTCGAVISILASQQEGRAHSGECMISVRDGKDVKSFDFRVRATPITLGKNRFTVAVFNDISGDKRRQTLERVFFHDLLNTVGGLEGWSNMIMRYKDLDPAEAAARILDLSQRLRQEIEDQRRLTMAEQNQLVVRPHDILVSNMLEKLRGVFSANDATHERNLHIDSAPLQEEIFTDAALLERVLVNMVKNALEAVRKGQTVRVWFERRNGKPVFCVNNEGVIPEPVALRIFQRSFSTKPEQGRGIGTYSMKLFGEKYLGGKVDFTTTTDGGTTFWIELPPEGPPEPAAKEE
ncbi:HAMP domain-containing histidine kinase [bacterium]|nr:HAMP domain-containing histidine kinase [bacterium]